MRLGQILKLYRLTVGLGIRGMAEKLDIAPSTLHRLELGRPVDMDNFYKVLGFLFEESDHQLATRVALLPKADEDEL